MESGEIELRFVRTKALVANQFTKNVVLQVLVAEKYLMGMLGD